MTARYWRADLCGPGLLSPTLSIGDGRRTVLHKGLYARRIRRETADYLGESLLIGKKRIISYAAVQGTANLVRRRK